MDANHTQAAATRLAAKLETLDLDGDEQAVLVGMLATGATSVEPTGNEVEGHSFNFDLVATTPISWSAGDDGPEEAITFEYGGLRVRYGH